MQAEIELLCTSKPQHLGCSTSMTTPPLTCDPGRADRVNLPRVLSPHEEATVRCAKARPGSNSSTGSQAPVRSKTSGPHASHSILPTDPVFINRCVAVRHAELIPSIACLQQLSTTNSASLLRTNMPTFAGISTTREL